MEYKLEDYLNRRNKPKRGLVDEPGSYSKTLSKETIAKRRKSFFDNLPESKRKNQRKWEKANPTKNFYDLNVSTQDSIRVTGRTDLGTFSKKEKAKTGGEGARLKNLEQRSQIDNWLKGWLDNNFENYGVRDKDKFLKDLKRDWKKAQKTEFKNNRLAQSGDLPGPSARFQGVGSGKNKRTVPNKKFFSMFDEALLQSSEFEKDRFYRRLFYAGQIDTNPELKKSINDYFKTVLTDKSRKAGLTQPKIDELNRFLGKNSDVAFILGTETGLENQMKQKIFGNRFKNYGAYREKISKASLKYMENVKKLEKITGIPIRKEISKEQRLLKKILNVDELPLELRYSIDHLYGISEAVRNPKDKVFARQVAENLIGGTFRQNAAAGLEGYAVRRKALINNIESGKNVTKSLARLNELTTETYPQFKNLKQPYKIVDGKLTFAKGFKGQTQPERFESYFREIYKTPKGKKIIQQQAGGLKQIIAKLSPNKSCALKFTKGGLTPSLDDCFEGGMRAIKEGKVNKPHQVQATKQLMNAGKRVGASKFANILANLGIVGEVAFIAGDIGVRQAMGRPFYEAFLAATFRDEKADLLRRERAGGASKELQEAERLDKEILNLNSQIENVDALGDFYTQADRDALIKRRDKLLKEYEPYRQYMTSGSMKNISDRMRTAEIIDSDRAKSLTSKMGLRDNLYGIPNIADYDEVDAGVSEVRPKERSVLPSSQQAMIDNTRRNLRALQIDESQMSDRTIGDFIKNEFTTQERMQAELDEGNREEQVLGFNPDKSLEIPSLLPKGTYIPRPGEEEELLEYMSKVQGAKDGGLMNLTRTTPPKRSLNKDSQGLASLPEYDR